MVDLFNPAAWGTTATTNLISLVLVAVTGAYVYLTWRIANANQGMLDNIREQYRDSVRPVVFPVIQFRDQIVARLVIANTGRSPAYRLRVLIDKDFWQFAERRNIRDFNLFNKEVPVLGPGAEIAIDLAQGFNLDREVDGRKVTPLNFDITVSYSSKGGEEFHETVAIDLAPYMQTHTPKTIAESLALIEKHLKTIAKSET
jgi:hypothetical protein